MLHLLGTAALGIVLSWLIYTQSELRPQCRCQPSEACWPSEEKWNSLNKSIDLNLVRLLPLGSVCYEPTLNPQACEEVMRLSKDSGWRASQPGEYEAEKYPRREEHFS